MDMKKGRDMQLAYISDEAVMQEQIRCRKSCKNLILQKRKRNWKEIGTIWYFKLWNPRSYC